MAGREAPRRVLSGYAGQERDTSVVAKHTTEALRVGAGGCTEAAPWLLFTPRSYLILAMIRSLTSLPFS